MAIKWDDINVEALNSHHDFSAFHCASDDLDDFIKNDALSEQNSMLSRTYLFLYGREVIGFVSLSADSVAAPLLRTDDIARKGDGKAAYKNFPCILIGRLAVIVKYEHKGIGTDILNWAVGLIMNSVCRTVGCRYITVDPKEESVGFYTESKWRFTQMEALRPGKKETRYYINMYKLLNE